MKSLKTKKRPTRSRSKPKSKTLRYSVYVIELRKSIYTESAKFRAANPQYKGVLECLYVGMTSKTPKQRMAQHINGIKSKKGHNISSNTVKKYGMYLRPSLYTDLNPMTRSAAIKMEEDLANKLKRQGYAVWWN